MVARAEVNFFCTSGGVCQIGVSATKKYRARINLNHSSDFKGSSMETETTTTATIIHSPQLLLTESFLPVLATSTHTEKLSKHPSPGYI